MIVVFALTDDQQVGTNRFLPFTSSLPWHLFPNNYLFSPLCAVTRAEVMTGQTTEYNGVVGNGTGYKLLDFNGRIAAAFRAAGKRAYCAGKYINNVPPAHDDTAIPDLDWWLAHLIHAKGDSYTEWTATNIVQGMPPTVEIDATGYQTTRIKDEAVAYIDEIAADGITDAWIYLPFTAPHQGAVPDTIYAGVPIDFPDPPGFNVIPSNAPARIPKVPMLDGPGSPAQECRDKRADGVRCMLSVDDAIQAIYDRFASHGLLDQLILITALDNGYAYGQFGIPMSGINKQWPYEWCLKAELRIHRPADALAQIPEDPFGNYVHNDLVSIMDVPTSIHEWCGVPPLVQQHGRSLTPILDGLPYRRRKWIGARMIGVEGNPPPWAWARERAITYAEYGGPRFGVDVPEEDNPRQLHDLQNDPEQLENLDGDPRYAEVQNRMKACLAEDDRHPLRQFYNGRPTYRDGDRYVTSPSLITAA